MENYKIILAGPQNAGKSTLFNHLTTGYARPVNYAGSTVDFHSAPLKKDFGLPGDLTDSPGIVGMAGSTPEQRLTVDYLLKERPDLVVAAVDITQIERHLLLPLHLKEAGHRVLIVVTMKDIAAQQGIRFNPKKLSDEIGIPVVYVDNRSNASIAEIIEAMKKIVVRDFDKQQIHSIDIPLEHIESDYARVSELVAKSVVQREVRVPGRDWDAILLHPLWGFIIFNVVMGGAFASVFWLADPLIGYVEGAFSWLGNQVTAAATPKDGLTPLWADFISEGIIGGIASFAVFLPPIIILYLVLSWLEDSGYLARAAMLADKPLSLVGLNGRSFLPMLSGFACALPAMMAARTIKNPIERKLTIIAIPLMSCAARLPVYGLFIMFFTDNAFYGGLIMSGLYFFSLMLGSFVAALLSRLSAFSSRESTLLLELPKMRAPLLKSIFKSTLHRSQSFVVSAGPTVFVIAVLLWLGTNMPFHKVENGQWQKSEIQQSYAAKVGKYTEPLMRPMGLDWRGSIAMISGFAAREVFVQALVISYKLPKDLEEADGENNETRALVSTLREAKFKDGTLIFTLSTCLGMLFYFTIALQCFPTVAMAKAETGSAKLALGLLLGYSGFAWIGAVIVVQLSRLCGLP